MNMFSFCHAVKKNSAHLAEKFGIPDLIVGCSIHPFTWLAAYKESKRHKARFFAEVRDLWPATWIYNRGMSPHHLLATYFGCLEKRTYKRAEKIIYSMSRGDKYICDILGFPKEKAVWIDQPMDCERFDNNAQRYEELPKDMRDFIQDSFLCVFGGYYIDYEGVFEMLKAAKILFDKEIPVKFVFVGSGNADDAMRSYADENKLSNVYIGGRINKELVPALLRRAQICLAHLAVRGNPNSYKFDASKNKINEYMYSGACIIYGTCVEDHFVKTSGAGFTIEPYSETEFAGTIEKVYQMEPEKRNRFGENAKKYILENNTLPKLTERYLLIIKDGEPGR
jgi:glycosyltransferase involved in cell wall biosynthesis